MRSLSMIRQALFSLANHKGKTLLMMLGPAVGVAALTIVVNVVEGSNQQMKTRVGSFGSKAINVVAGDGTPPPELDVTTLTLDDARAIEKQIPESVIVAPGLQRRGFPIEHEGNYSHVIAFGVTPAWKTAWNWKVSRGRPINGEDLTGMKRVCVVGQTVRREVFGGADPLGKTLRVGKSAFTVIGELPSRGASPCGGDMDNRVLLPLTTMMRRVANVDHISHIRVVLKKTSMLPSVAKKLRKIMRKRHDIQPPEEDDFGIITPKTISKITVEISHTLKTLLFVVALVCLLGGGVVVMSIMLMALSERTHEIGLRRALGATRRDILTQFLSEAVLATTAGGFLGLALGVGGLGLLTHLGKTPPAFSVAAVGLGIGASAVIGTLFGLLPALRAARLQPVDALRD